MPHSVNSKRDVDSGLASFLLLAHFYGVPAEGEQLRHEFGQSDHAFDEVTLLRVGKHLGFSAKAVDSNWERMSIINLPAIAQHNDGHYVLLARADSDKVLVHDPLESRPLTLPKDIFEQAWSGRLILFTQRAGVGEDNRKFDFSWFIPAIVKHRKLLGEVMLASFFI